jgi:two-component system KDP operon response regulator KdpE
MPVQSERASPVRNFAPLRILIVDDEPLIRWSLSNTLRDSGHDAVEAVNAATALRAVVDAEVPFDVMLLDFRLPDSRSLDLLAQLRRLTPSTSLVLMTAYGTPEVVQGALDLGAFRVVGKPLDMRDVVSLVQDASSASH